MLRILKTLSFIIVVGGRRRSRITSKNKYSNWCVKRDIAAQTQTVDSNVFSTYCTYGQGQGRGVGWHLRHKSGRLSSNWMSSSSKASRCYSTSRTTARTTSRIAGPCFFCMGMDIGSRTKYIDPYVYSEYTYINKQNYFIVRLPGQKAGPEIGGAGLTSRCGYSMSLSESKVQRLYETKRKLSLVQALTDGNEAAV